MSAETPWSRRLRDLETVRPLVTETPLVLVEDGVPGGNRLWLKLESSQPVRSFKIRGATYAMSSRLEDLRSRGVVADSGGNHSQALAYAGARLGVPVKIVMAAVVPEGKKRATLGFGATDGSFELDTSPPDFVAAKVAAKEAARAEGRHYLSPYDDEDIIRGAATLLTEAVGQLSARGVSPASVHAPIGGGGLISGLADANADLGSPMEVRGHEIEGADSAARSITSDRPVEVPGELNRYAEGLAVRVMGDRPHRRLRDGLVAGVDVTTLRGVGGAYAWWIEHARPALGESDRPPDLAGLPEVSSMVAVAGVLRHLEERGIVDGDHLVVVSGGNTDPTSARATVAAYEGR